MMFTRIRKYRLLTPVLLVLFSISAIGIHLDVHLCKGHISGIKLISFAKASQATSCCPTICSLDLDDQKNCCSDEEINASMDYDGMPIVIEVEKSVQYNLLSTAPDFDLRRKVPIHFIVPSDTGPPISKVHKRILFQSFLC